MCSIELTLKNLKDLAGEKLQNDLFSGDLEEGIDVDDILKQYLQLKSDMAGIKPKSAQIKKEAAVKKKLYIGTLPLFKSVADADIAGDVKQAMKLVKLYREKNPVSKSPINELPQWYIILLTICSGSDDRYYIAMNMIKEFKKLFPQTFLPIDFVDALVRYHLKDNKEIILPIIAECLQKMDDAKNEYTVIIEPVTADVVRELKNIVDGTTAKLFLIPVDVLKHVLKLLSPTSVAIFRCVSPVASKLGLADDVWKSFAINLKISRKPEVKAYSDRLVIQQLYVNTKTKCTVCKQNFYPFELQLCMKSRRHPGFILVMDECKQVGNHDRCSQKYKWTCCGQKEKAHQKLFKGIDCQCWTGPDDDCGCYAEEVLLRADFQTKDQHFCPGLTKSCGKSLHSA